MSTKTAPSPAANYDADFYAWTQDQAEKLRARRQNEIDWENVAEEIESVGRSQKKEIRSRLLVLLLHLLKWEFQPDRRKGGWQASIIEARDELSSEIEDSPSLRSYPAQALDRQYDVARLKAIAETGLPDSIFPKDCPYTVEQVLDFGFMPGQPWHPEDLIRD
jgi:hypothetical protein